LIQNNSNNNNNNKDPIYKQNNQINYNNYNNNYNNDVKETSNTSYKELLEQKIRNQAKRLCELQDYKNLCEKRLLQVFPGHPLPVEQKHFGDNYNENYFSFEGNKGSLSALSDNCNKNSFDKVKINNNFNLMISFFYIKFI